MQPLHAWYNYYLNDHLIHSAKNARYLSPKIQNEFIVINGNLIRQSIVEECNKALFRSLMADETTDVSTVEQVSICVRYVCVKDEELEVCEEFLGFVSVPSTGAEVITSAIDGFLKSSGLDLNKFIGKGFDGASTMSGHISGVSARLQTIYPRAKYFTHCRNHALNLVIVASCQEIPDIRNFMDTLKQLTLFFGYSSKRKHILLKHMSSQEQEDFLADSIDDSESDDTGLVPERKYRGIPVLSDTRWLMRIDSINCLLKNYLPICEAIEEIRDCSSGQSAHDADSYLNRMMTFEFIASAVICHQVLAYTRPLNVALQQKKCDLFKAHEMAQRLIESLKGERTTAKFAELWSKVKKVASTLNIEPAKKRTVSRQTARSNPPVTDIEAYYRVSYFFAFIDHAVQHLSTRFPPNLENAMLATHLLPSNVSSISDATIAKLTLDKKLNFLLQDQWI